MHMIINLESLINELTKLLEKHGNVDVSLGVLSEDKEYVKEEKINFISFEYYNQVIIYGESIRQE